MQVTHQFYPKRNRTSTSDYTVAVVLPLILWNNILFWPSGVYITGFRQFLPFFTQFFGIFLKNFHTFAQKSTQNRCFFTHFLKLIQTLHIRMFIHIFTPIYPDFTPIYPDLPRFFLFSGISP